MWASPKVHGGPFEFLSQHSGSNTKGETRFRAPGSAKCQLNNPQRGTMVNDQTRELLGGTEQKSSHSVICPPGKKVLIVKKFELVARPGRCP